MTIYAGTVDSFAGSMAEAIEIAFGAELMALKGLPLPTASAEERRMLFCAIAQGVLGYLAAHETDLSVSLDVSGTNTSYVSLGYAVHP